MQLDDEQPISVIKFFKFMSILSGGLIGVVTLMYIVWPGLVFYLLIIFLGGETSHSYRAALQLGKRGDVFLIDLSMRSSSTEIQDLASGRSIREYLIHNGPTDAIWSVIIRGLIYHKSQNRKNIYVIQNLENYIYGPYIFDPKIKKSVRVFFFSKDKIQWVNTNIFQRAPDYGLPDEGDEALLKSYKVEKNSSN